VLHLQTPGLPIHSLQLSHIRVHLVLQTGQVAGATLTLKIQITNNHSSRV